MTHAQGRIDHFFNGFHSLARLLCFITDRKRADEQYWLSGNPQTVPFVDFAAVKQFVKAPV